MQVTVKLPEVKAVEFKDMKAGQFARVVTSPFDQYAGRIVLRTNGNGVVLVAGGGYWNEHSIEAQRHTVEIIPTPDFSQLKPAKPAEPPKPQPVNPFSLPAGSYARGVSDTKFPGIAGDIVYVSYREVVNLSKPALSWNRDEAADLRVEPLPPGTEVTIK